MRILVLNGSPKGEYSVTLQTALYAQKKFPELEFSFFHAGAKIASLQKDLSPLKETLEAADVILFTYPVYTFLAPYQLHKTIELIKSAGIDLRGKYAAQLSTSKHFYDVTAHRYIEENCADLGLRYVGGLSADMEDLLNEKGRKQAEEFFSYLVYCVENGIFWDAQPAYCHEPVTVLPPREAPSGDRGDIVIVTDAGAEDTNLLAMIDQFRSLTRYRTRVVNIAEYPFRGGCLGCFACAVTGKCVYQDGFDTFLREQIQQSDATVYAFTLRDHSMGSRFKLYDDRQFCNGHRSVTMGRPVAYLVSGALSREHNVKMLLEARAQVGGNFLAGIATDEKEPLAQIGSLISRLEYALEHDYTPPADFYGVGGMKIFRDLIWLMQGMMRADHRFYKAHGQYDFPQKHWPRMLAMYMVGAMLSSPKLMSKAGSKMKEGMLMPYRKVLEDMDKMPGGKGSK